MKSDTQIKREGFEILSRVLGMVDMERFIALVNREKFNYTQWRQNLFDGMSIKEISAAAEKFSTETFSKDKSDNLF